jgi:broad specificity phosphatase PhoE
MSIRYLYLIRHGQYDNLKDIHDPELEGGLSSLGQKQAIKTARIFQDTPVTALHVSTLRRAAETALPFTKLFPSLSPQYSRRLWECTPPVTLDYAQAFNDMTPALFQEEERHAQACFDYYFKRTRGGDKHEILVTHGNLIRYLVCRCMQVDPSAWIRMESRNCGITRAAIDGQGQIFLISYNDIAHLPPHLHTDNLYFPPRPNAPKGPKI